MPSRYLDADDRIRLARSLSSTDLAQSLVDRRNLLKLAALDRFLPGLPIGDGISASTFVQSLIIKLEEFGPLPEDSRFEALGRLLSYLVEQDTFPADDRGLFADLIVRYDLIKEPAAIAKLRSEYKIEAARVRESPGIAVRASPLNIKPANGPAPAAIAYDVSELERVINSEDNFLDIAQLAAAIYCARAVCLIQNPKGDACGTGFLIGPDLLITNNHVLPSAAHLAGAAALFDFANDLNGYPSAGREFAFDPSFFHTSVPEELDYSIVRLTAKPLPGLSKEDVKEGTALLELMRRGKHRGYLLLAPNFIPKNQRVGIIQHPQGDPSKVVLTQNYVPIDMTDRRVQYVADTKAGSSGSPVFNRNWEVVALHHSGAPYPAVPVGQSLDKAGNRSFRVNEGIPIRAILADFKAKQLDKYLTKE